MDKVWVLYTFTENDTSKPKLVKIYSNPEAPNKIKATHQAHGLMAEVYEYIVHES